MSTFMNPGGHKARVFPKRRATFAAWALLLVGTVAFAADEPADTNKRPMSAGEVASQSRDYMTKMQDTQRNIVRLRELATKKKDILKLNCVNDKLNGVRGHLLVADNSMSTLNAAQQRGDTGARDHEFTRLTILYQKVLVLGTEAENCIGEDVNYVGATKVDVDIDPSVPSDDPTEPQLPLPEPTRPAEATPFA
jgi:hypothetical protein